MSRVTLRLIPKSSWGTALHQSGVAAILVDEAVLVVDTAWSDRCRKGLCSGATGCERRSIILLRVANGADGVTHD
ncbi:MAG: hypothetical protein J7449_05805 [Thermomicrobium sp.]|uniref:hypothetical protein n=1 Tax=Thermomicrobium sp. TaxID=1969469 RepID=UPI001B2B96CC|nr:hypothetical protein [Thermomicrobium sp.]MBO9350974.1 hypothetical protein [Thermomicrobium sp.]